MTFNVDIQGGRLSGLRGMVWDVACWLAATQGVNLNRAIYVGPRATTLDWRGGVVVGNRIHGAEFGLRYSGCGTVSTVFGEAKNNFCLRIKVIAP
jgi:hypothetical protein